MANAEHAMILDDSVTEIFGCMMPLDDFLEETREVEMQDFDWISAPLEPRDSASRSSHSGTGKVARFIYLLVICLFL